MPPHPLSPAAAFWVTLISLFIVATLTGMLITWSWAVGRLRRGRPLLAAPKPRAVPWKIGSVLLVFLAYLVINVGVSIGYFKVSGMHRNHREPTFAEQMAVVSLVNGMLLLAIPSILQMTSGAKLADLGLTRRGLSRQVLAGAVGFLLIAPLVYTLNGLAVLIWQQNKHPLEKMVVSEPSVGTACLAFLSAVVLAPAAEELIFRGIIQSWLTRLFRRPAIQPRVDNGLAGIPDPLPDPTAADPETQPADSSPSPPSDSPGYGPPAVTTEPLAEEGVPSSILAIAPAGPLSSDSPPRERSSLLAIAVTSAVFAALHLPQWPAPLAIFFLSMGLGIVYQGTGSLIASFAMHALFNGFSTMLLFFSVLVGPPDPPKAVPNPVDSPITSIVPGP